MSERVATTTILYAIPRLARDVVVRPAALSLLEKANDAQLLAFVAPSGFGKTTFLTQHARGLGTPVLWLELQDLTNASGLANGLLEVFALAFPELKPELKPESNTPGTARAVALTLAQTPAATIILDQADHLNLEGTRWLEQFVSELPEGTRLLVAGRELEHLRLPSLIADGRALVIGPNELAFTPEETSTYLKARGFTRDMLEVQRSLEGWPAGIALVAAGAALNLSPTDLVRDVLQRLPEKIREALPEASVLEVWNEDAAFALGCRLPKGWLRIALRAGLPLLPLGQQTYRPLQALRDVLEVELKRKALRHATLHLAAGSSAEKTGRTLGAIGHYLLAHREDEALRLIEKVAPSLFERAEYTLLCQTLESLPLTVLPAHLRELLGVALGETEQTARGEVLLRQLRAKRELGSAGLWMLGKLALRDAKFERTLELAQEGLQIGGGSTDTIRFLRLKGFALSDLGWHGEALAVALEALELAERSDDLNQIGQAIWLAQGEHYHLGQFGACERLIKRGIEVYEAMDQPLRAATLYNDLANLQCLANRSDEARATLEPVLANAQQEQSNVLHVLLETLADLHLWLGEFGPAATNYQLATESIARFQDIEIHRYWLKYAEARWRDGKHQEAEAVLNKSRKVIPEDAETLQGRRAFLQGFIAFDQGHLEVALAHFQDSKRSDDMTQKPRALALSAEIARRTGKLEQHHLQELFENLDSMPSDAVLNTDQVYLTELWRETQTRGWFVERISGFAAQAGLPALKLIVKPTLAKPETSITTHRVRLEIITLGKLQVRVAGQTVKLPFAKAGELLIWLALHGPSNHEQVIDALWDGSNEDKHHEYFRVAVRRLRSTLAGPLPESDTFNPLPFERGTYTLSDQLEVVLDTHQARFALENNAPDEASQALEAYRGEFLPGVDTQWVTELRTQCLENTVTLALTLGEQLEASQPREALRTYRRAVELEPLNELGHLGLIRTHLALGGLPAANQAYGTYNRMLHEEFGLEPSANLRRTLNDLGLRV